MSLCCQHCVLLQAIGQVCTCKMAIYHLGPGSVHIHRNGTEGMQGCQVCSYVSSAMGLSS